MRLEGAKEELARIAETQVKAKEAAQAGLLAFGINTLAEAQSNLKPSVITGNLRGGGYVRNNQTSHQPNKSDQKDGKSIATLALPELSVEIGFLADYAEWVHEYMEGRAPKFLENALNKQIGNISKYIEAEAKARGVEL